MKIFRLASYALCVGGTIAILGGCGANSFSAPPLTGGASAAGHGVPAKLSDEILYSFSGGNDGGNAATAVVFDGHGNLYGTTAAGGAYLCGTVFKLTPNPTPPWNEAVLYNFGCFGDGKDPHGGVTFDPHGNLDGTTVAGGNGGACASDGCGIVYQLTSTTENVLYNFKGGNDGFGPGGGVIYNKAGNTFGTTPDGGRYSHGIVYEVSARHERILHAFTGGKDGSTGSLGLLLRDSTTGSLYGVTELGGGSANAGTVFRLTPNGTHWTFTTLYTFKGTPDAGSPYGGLIADSRGKNLYGTTYFGGAHGMGSIFELSPGSHGKYRERVLYSFKGGSDGSLPTSTLVFGKSSALYGTTSSGGGSCGCGTIFKFDPTTHQESVLHKFGSSSVDGAYSYYGMTTDSSGALYGTTVAGGSFGQGTVFKFVP